jgi:hypothetical protein
MITNTISDQDQTDTPFIACQADKPESSADKVLSGMKEDNSSEEMSAMIHDDDDDDD